MIAVINSYISYNVHMLVIVLILTYLCYNEMYDLM